MKTILATLFFAASALAQASPDLAHAEAACGPLNVTFDAEAAPARPTPPIDPHKALVYVIEDLRKAPGDVGDPTIRVGLDGAWLGATRANSYLFFSVDPGEHHLCTSWQSRLKRLSRLAAFFRFKAEQGKIYYLRTRIIYSTDGAANLNLDLEPVDADEGQFLVSSFQLSHSLAKK